MAHLTEERMFTLIRQWQRSGISQKDFCEKKDIAYATFHYWYRKFRDVDPPDKVVSSFVPLSIPATTLSSFCTVRLLEGVSIDFHAPVPPGYLNQLGK
jgi:hypothetical protein